MPNVPTLLFLHGVGDGDQADDWKAELSASLTRLGHPTLDGVRTMAPKYPQALKLEPDDKDPLPGLTIKKPAGDAARQVRRDFERRIGAVEFRLGRHAPGLGIVGGEAAFNFALSSNIAGSDQRLLQARNYATNAKVRAHVLTRSLSGLPAQGRLVIVGHSLGSVVAADLLCRLPAGLDVVGMVTIGSPLANTAFNVDKLREVLADPPTNLAWWVNIWNGADPIAARRGASSAFPWLLDLRIQTNAMGIAAHSATDYLANDTVAEAIGYALFGSRSKEIAVLDSGADIPLNAAETLTLLALRYAHLIEKRLEGGQRNRFQGALRQVQATAVETIRRQNHRMNRPIPSHLARLAFDLSNPSATAPAPMPITHLSKDDAVALLTVVSAENVIRPFEITIDSLKERAAMAELTAEMGLGHKYGSDVVTAGKLARDALKPGLGASLLKVGALGASAVALAAVAGGVGLVGAVGLMGAAAIAGALTTFGPDGMIGGLLAAGALVTAGGGVSIASSLASPTTSSETLAAVVSQQLTTAILRQLQHLEQDPLTWAVLTDTEIAARREHERLDEFSDPSSASLKDLKRKIDTLELALNFLSKQGLEPGASVG